MSTVLEAAGNFLVAAGILVSVGALLRRIPVVVALACGLELWLGASLLRLSASRGSWQAIAVAAVIVLIRKLAISGLGGVAHDGWDKLFHRGPLAH